MPSYKLGLLILVILVVVVAIILWKPVIVPEAPVLVKIDYHVAAGAANEMRALIIKKYGIDKKYGLDMNIIAADPGELERQLVNGETDIAEVSPFSLIDAYNKNRLLKIIAPSLHFTYSIAVPNGSNVKNIQDLKGARLGVLPKASAAYLALALTFKSVNLEPQKDFQLAFGNISQTITSLQKGDVDAAMVAYPGAAKVFATGKFKDLGFLEKAWSQKENGLPMTFVVVAASDEWVKNNKDTADKLVKILIDASSFIRQNPNVLGDLTDYLNRNQYNSSDIVRLIEQNTPELLLNQWGDTEMNSLRRMFDRAKEFGIIPNDAPSADAFLVKL